MSSSVILAMALAAGTSASPDLCRGQENKIEPDMRVLESDLTQEAAIEASEKLRAMLAGGDIEGEMQFGAFNQLKIIHGHLLLQRAQTNREAFGQDSPAAGESLGALCTWLGSEGYWHD